MTKKLLLLLSLLLYGSMMSQLFAQESITLTLASNHPKTIKLKVIAEGEWTIEGVKESAVSTNKKTVYTAIGETIRLVGNIRELDCASASLTALDLTTSSKLRKLDCSLNEIQSLDLSAHKELQRIDCNSNELTVLSVAQNSQLAYLDCGRNKIRSITLSCSKLEELNCGANLLSELNLADCIALNTVMCHQNKIKGDGMKRLIQNLPQCAMDGGIVVIIDTDEIGEGNVCTKDQVAQLKEKQWDAYNWRGGNFEEYAGSDNVEPIKKEIIRFTTSKSVGEKLFITIDGSSDISFTGLKESPVIKGQGATEYTLTSSDVSITGSRITLFSCTVGGITKADFSEAPSLSSLNISSNALTTLDLSAQKALQMLHCGINKLEELNLEPLVNLQWVNCVQNAISSLNLSYNDKLISLNCAANKLSELHIGGESLNTIFCYGNTIKELDLTRCPNLIRLEAFENKLEKIDVSNSPNLELLYCGTNQLKSLDLSKNTNLRELGCGSNLLEVLDLSQQKNLSILYVTDNKLQTLMLSPQATQLERIDCYHNKLVGQAMSRFIATIPIVSTEDYQEIYLYDSTSSLEGNKVTPEQVQSIREKNWKVYDQNGENPLALSREFIARDTFRYILNAASGALTFTGAKEETEYLLFDIHGLLISSILTDDSGAGCAYLPNHTRGKYILSGKGLSHILIAN